MAGSMMTSVRYSVPQAAALGGYQTSWQPQYTILPQQMMQGVEGSPYSVSQLGQLAAQMSQLGLSSPVRDFLLYFLSNFPLFLVISVLSLN
jgi:hypothetical protein